MKKLALLCLLLTGTVATGLAQTAKQVLDKCAATVSAASGVSARFIMNSAQYGNSSGTIAIKGQKFCMKSAQTSMWFDGTTLWTYVASNDEVNISKPTAQQLQTLNPYTFINLYKKGFSQTMTTSATDFNVHLTATDQQHKIREAFLTIDKKSYAPKEIKMLTGNKWTTFSISDMKAETLADAAFRFDSKAYPDAEVIDLR